MIHKAQKNPKTVVYPEGEEEKIIRAAHVCYSENIAKPVLLGNESKIKKIIEELDYNPSEFIIEDPETSEKSSKYAEDYYQRRQRKGVSLG